MSASDLLILTAADVDAIISSLDLEAALSGQSQVFEAYSNAAPSDILPIQTPQRLSIQSQQATSLFMPARVAGSSTACKIVSIPRNGGAEGLPATTLVIDDEGKVRGIVNARKLTALRNACGSALVLRAVSFPKPPTSLLIFGSGAQAHSHATVFLRLFPSLSTVTFAVRSRNDRATALVDSLSDTFHSITFALEVTSTPSGPADLTQVVGSSDIIVTVTSSTEALFPSVAVKAGTRLVLVGSYTPKMREVEDELIKRAGVLVVDSKEACGHEAGELISAGVKDGDMVEIGEIVSDKAARESVGQGGDVVVFKSVGLGIQDVAIAKLVFDVAVEKGLGQTVKGYDV